jgi:hypothetical protein
MRYVVHVAHVGEKREAYWVLMGKSEGNTTGKTRNRWEDTFKIIFKK